MTSSVALSAKDTLKAITAAPYGALLTVIATAYLAVVLVCFQLRILNFIYVYFLRPGKNLKKSYGSWAIVTGATDGIGKGYSIELARKGLNLVLISRTQSKLDEFASELQSKYPSILVKTVAANLTNPSAETLSSIAATVDDLDIGILVNNAGMSYSHPDYLENLDAPTDNALININAVTPTQLCRVVLPGMKARRRGVIVNIGSANGLIPSVPLLATYAGTKAYINQLTRSLDAETTPFGVRVHDQCPFFVATKMAKIRRARLDAPTPRVWARAAIKQLGYDTVRTPYWYHGIMKAVVDVLPAWAVTVYVRNLHVGFRKKALKKKAEKEGGGNVAQKKGL